MAVKASAETIREMKKQIAQTIKDIERINQGIKSGIRATGSWDDAKAAEFNMLMQKIARLTVSPVETLNSVCLPKANAFGAGLWIIFTFTFLGQYAVFSFALSKTY